MSNTTLQSSQPLAVNSVNAGVLPRSARDPPWVVWGVFAALLVAYAALSHYSTSNPGHRGLATGLTIGPVFLIGMTLLWRWTRPLTALLSAALALAGLYRLWPVLAEHYEWGDLVEQSGAYMLVALSFVRTLYGDRVPLCTRLSLELHGSLTPAEVLYTRRATRVWAVFYVLLATTIVILFWSVSHRVWSLFVNFATFGLIAIACSADAVVRRAVLPRRPGGGLFALLRQTLIG